jgi:P-type Ca2+ transporter type 2C
VSPAASAAKPSPPSRAPGVIPLSTAVPGRVRLRVAALRRRPQLRDHLEAVLSRHGAVHAVHASTLTGSVLVRFDPARMPLLELIREVSRAATAAARTPRAARSALTLVRAEPGAAFAEIDWHALDAPEVERRLGTALLRGLSGDEVARRLALHGANWLPEPQARSAGEIVARHLLSLPVLLLGGAAALSVVSGALVEAAVILTVVGMNTAVGYVTESRVERILTSLQNGGAARAVVRRDGVEVSLDASELVPGDVLLLRAGQEVPADARVVEATGLAVDEASLTGESVPVSKHHAAVDGARTLAERTGSVHAGTVVVEGAGVGLVVATGRHTELGRLRALVDRAASPPTPLERQLDTSGRQLVLVCLGLCGVALVVGAARGMPALQLARTVISLAVAAVPEGLPAVATTTLALGVQRMLRRGMLVRRLAAAESLGATTVICADKTGTLTENRMAVAAWHFGGREHGTDLGDAATRDAAAARALEVIVLCNEAELDGPTELRGSSTEGALLAAAQTAGLDYREIRGRHPLRAIRRRGSHDSWMGTVHDNGSALHVIAVKGAPEEVLTRADRWLGPDGAVLPLDAESRRAVLEANRALARRGLRVLGLAHGETSADPAPFERLIWIGLVGLTDPVRPGVREAIEACRAAGIRTVILTGDQAQTAVAISEELGLSPDGHAHVVEPARLAGLDPAKLSQLVRSADVFARVSPSGKHEIVRSLQAGGDVVTMTGDGVNDAAALRAADTGVAMGARGTDVARDVADVVLLEDDFGALVEAVAQGRAIQANITRALEFLLATNLSEILVTLGALWTRMAPTPAQLLWINLLSDVAPALALAIEPPDRDVMARPPRDPAAPLLDQRLLRRIALDAALIAGGTLLVQTAGRARYGAGPAGTMAFTTLTAAQLLHALRCRARPGSVPDGRSVLLPVTAGSLLAQAATLTLPPLRRLLGLTPLPPLAWAIALAGATLPTLISGLSSAGSAALSAGPTHIPRIPHTPEEA